MRTDCVGFLKEFRKRSSGEEIEYGRVLPFWQGGNVESLTSFKSQISLSRFY